MHRIKLFVCLLFSFSTAYSETVHVSFELSDQTVTVNPLSSVQTLIQAEETITPNRVMPPSSNTSAKVRRILGHGDSTIDIVTGCTFFYTPLTNCQIHYDEPNIESFSGGHEHHDTARSGGKLDRMDFNTGSEYTVTIKYTAPEEGGLVSLTGYASHPGILGSVSKKPYYIEINMAAHAKVGKLKALPPSIFYDHIGQHGNPRCGDKTKPVTSMHSENHYGTNDMIKTLIKLADSYNYNFLFDKLQINDLSLKIGGLFDTKNNWSHSHYFHSTGQDVDICIKEMPKKNRKFLKRLAKIYGYEIIGVYPYHVHFKYWK